MRAVPRVRSLVAGKAVAVQFSSAGRLNAGWRNAARHVSALTRRSRSNFYYSFLSLPRPQREAIFAVYAFCRSVDDVVDMEANPVIQRQNLMAWKEEVARCFDGTPDHPVAHRLAEVIKNFRLPREYFEEILNGIEMDILKNRYETFEDLRPYCYRVASVVGLICLRVFGCRADEADDYGVNLGLALQLTNIMRDVRADAERGRIYLPRAEMARFGYPEEDLLASRYTPAFVALMTHQAARAREYFNRAQAAFPRAARRRLMAAEIMGGIYRRLLWTIEARHYNVFDGPVRVPASRKAWIALSCWARAHFP